MHEQSLRNLTVTEITFRQALAENDYLFSWYYRTIAH